MRRLIETRTHLSLFAALVATTASVASAAEVGTIEFKLTIKETEKGPVYCHLFAGEKGFPMKVKEAQTKLTAKVDGATATCRFTKVKPGTYAVMAFHDLNGNGKLDTNWMGIPREGVVSSNNAKGRMGPPSFEDASFEVEAGAMVEQSLPVKYY